MGLEGGLTDLREKPRVGKCQMGDLIRRHYFRHVPPRTCPPRRITGRADQSTIHGPAAHLAGRSGGDGLMVVGMCSTPAAGLKRTVRGSGGCRGGREKREKWSGLCWLPAMWKCHLAAPWTGGLVPPDWKPLSLLDLKCPAILAPSAPRLLPSAPPLINGQASCCRGKMGGM